jgi:phage tail-like protein
MASPTFKFNAHRHDPYRTFKFQVIIDNKVVAGLKKMSALKKTTESVSWRSAGDPNYERKLPGGTKFEAITLEQGLTHDPIFEEWANSVNDFDGDAAMSLKNFRKDLIVNVLNMQGQVAFSYFIKRAWVSEYQALPELDASNMNTIGIQTIKLEHEGWVRDTSVAEPTES